MWTFRKMEHEVALSHNGLSGDSQPASVDHQRLTRIPRLSFPSTTTTTTTATTTTLVPREHPPTHTVCTATPGCMLNATPVPHSRPHLMPPDRAPLDSGGRGAQACINTGPENTQGAETCSTRAASAPAMSRARGTTCRPILQIRCSPGPWPGPPPGRRGRWPRTPNCRRARPLRRQCRWQHAKLGPATEERATCPDGMGQNGPLRLPIGNPIRLRLTVTGGGRGGMAA